jgi:hypothetical protein
MNWILPLFVLAVAVVIYMLIRKNKQCDCEFFGKNHVVSDAYFDAYCTDCAEFVNCREATLKYLKEDDNVQ